jgi:hypothetical protein
MNVTYRPIGTDWPGKRTPTDDRRYSPFRRHGQWNAETSQYIGRGDTPWPSTLQLLEKELNQLGANSVVFQIDLRESDIRLDGLPRADARPADPAVIISFKSKHGPLRYFCDQFRAWQDNVRAIALGLEALRKVERYGITHRGEQYAGWKQLPPSSGTVEGVVRHFANVQEAAEYMLAKAGVDGGLGNPLLTSVVMTDKAYRDDLFRRISRKAHPDAGGDRADWDALVEARRMLETAQ